MRKFPAVVLMALCSFTSWAGVIVESPWVRGTVEGQQTSGAFMTLRTTSDIAIVGVATPVAGMAEIHEMKLEGGVMKMRAAPRLSLSAGQTIALKPGGYHIMLMGLKRPLKTGDIVPITLKVEGAGRKIESVTVKAEVRDLTAMPPEHEHHH